MGYTVLGFAVLAVDENGQRVIIYSDDIDEAKLEITQENMRVIRSDDGDVHVGAGPLIYHLNISGEHLNIRMDTEPLDNLLAHQPPQIESEG